MPKLPVDLSDIRILITNDDGYQSPGIKLLEKLALLISSHVVVCAPEKNNSAKSHSLTMDRNVKLVQHGPSHFHVDGTPVDSAIIGVEAVMKRRYGRKPDLVLSGINRGFNLADDIAYSGTVAAAREAIILGVPAIAFSLEVKDADRGPNWKVAETHLLEVLKKILSFDFPEGVLVNVNFPDVDPSSVKEMKVVPQGKYKIGDYVRPVEGQESTFRLGHIVHGYKEGRESDFSVVRDGGISVTPITVDTTAHLSLEYLRDVIIRPVGESTGPDQPVV